ncbi:hypothetical protein LCGC14_2441340, partial [marine sediment metagenome]
PDGRKIAFTAKDKESSDEKELKEKCFAQEVYEEKLENNHVWVSDLPKADAWDDAEETKPLCFDVGGHASGVRWSPRGKQLAVAVAPTPLIDDHYMKRKIHVIGAGDGSPLGVIENPGKLSQIGYSPDGKYLAMISGVDIHDPREGRLMVVSVPGNAVPGNAGPSGDGPDKGKPRDLMPDYQAHVNSFAFKDDQTLLWVAGEGTAATVGEVTLDGEKNLLIDATDQKLTSPVLYGLTLSENGRTAALIGNTSTHPSEVFLLSKDGHAARRLTDSNPQLDEMQFADQEVVRFKARDGVELEGVLVYPLHYQKGRRYPLILCVHGGPESHVSNGWVTYYSRPGQVAAARGFAVFYPNYRGSTGRGVEFSKLGQADAAGKEFDDLVDAVDHLAEIGLVDRDKVGITGGSYGGYASGKDCADNYGHACETDCHNKWWGKGSVDKGRTVWRDGRGVHPNWIIPNAGDPIAGSLRWMDTVVQVSKA